MYGKAFWHVALPAILIISLCSCTFRTRYSEYAGVSYVAPLGNPPASNLAWSPREYSQILVTSSRGMNGPVDLSLLDVNTNKATILVHADSGSISGAAWSPNASSISLSIWGGTKGYDPGLWLLDIGDHSMQLIDDEPGDTVWFQGDNTLGWFGLDPTPGARRLKISRIDPQTKTEKLLYSKLSNDAFAGESISPDGDTIAFALHTIATAASDVFILDLKSGSISQLTHDGRSLYPTWSPNGSLIAYYRTKESSGGIRHVLHLIAPDSACDVEIPEFIDGLAPSWSPDGRQLAFIGPDGIYVLDLKIFLDKYMQAESCIKF